MVGNDRSLSVLVLVGSANPASSTKTLACAAGELLAENGVTVHLWEHSALPFAGAALPDDSSAIAAVRQLIALADEVDGFVLASPVYHNSYSGLLKNLLDHLSVPQFLYKPVGLLSHAGARSSQALDQLRIVVRGLNGVSLPTQICTTAEDYKETEGGDKVLSSELVLSKVDRFVREMVVLGSQLREARLLLSA